jgi:FixJ family two-component response regulator
MYPPPKPTIPAFITTINPVYSLKLIKAVAEGQTIKEIAANEKVPFRRIENHLSMIKETYGAKSLPHLVHLAYCSGVLQLPAPVNSNHKS